MNIKINMMLIFSIFLLTQTLTAHENYKNVKEGVIEPQKCEHHGEGENHTVKCSTMHSKNGYVIVSPKSRYKVAKSESNKIAKFIKNNQTLNVAIELERENHNQDFKIKSMKKR